MYCGTIAGAIATGRATTGGTSSGDLGNGFGKGTVIGIGSKALDELLAELAHPLVRLIKESLVTVSGPPMSCIEVDTDARGSRPGKATGGVSVREEGTQG